MVVIFTHNMWIFNRIFPGHYYYFFQMKGHPLGLHLLFLNCIWWMNKTKELSLSAHLTCREEPGAFGRGSRRGCPGSTPHLGSNIGTERLSSPWVERCCRRNCREHFNSSLHPVLKYLQWLQLHISWLLQCEVCCNNSFPKSLSCPHD